MADTAEPPVSEPGRGDNAGDRLTAGPAGEGPG